MAYAMMLGRALRVTKTDKCGKPLDGAANRLVTEGFIRVNLTPNMKAAEDIQQENAAGKNCVKGRTPPERNWWDVEIQFCNVDPDLYALLCSWARVLDYAGNPIGFIDSKSVDVSTGVGIEVWTGTGDDDGCAPPVDDSAFSLPDSGELFGYLLLVGKEFVSGAVTVEKGVATFTLTGLTVAPKGWGRGPYNVAKINSDGDAGRLLTEAYNEDKDNHLVVMSTPIPPPAPTDGAVPLDISGTFVAPTYYYYGSPANGIVDASDVAPEQVAVDQGYNVTLTGGPTGGNVSLLVEYPDQPDKTALLVLWNSTPGQAKTILVALDDGYASSDWDVTGTNLPTGPILIVPPPGVVIKEGANNLTGGTSPDLVVAPAA